MGNLDTLVDVVGSIVGLELLGIERLYSSPMPSGSGTIKTSHGILPIPAPATAALFAMARVPVVPPPGNAPDAGEMVTPTGAAIITTLASFKQPAMRYERVGYGIGSRDTPLYPNVISITIGEETGGVYNNEVSLLETNIDDMTPAMLSYVQERLFEMGALDVWFTPIQMKKNRPATVLSVLVPVSLESQAVTLVMKESSTLGIRVRQISRYEADREEAEVDTEFGKVQVKIKKLEGRSVAVSPEFEACRKIAIKRKLPLQEVYRRVQQTADQQLLSS